MTVASPLSLDSTLSAGLRTGFNLRRMDFRALATALKASDIGAAQTEFAKLEENSPRLANALNHAPKAAEPSRVAALRTLATAIQSGDLAAAQEAFAAVQPHGQSVNRGQHRGHAVKESAPETTPAPETTTAPIAATGFSVVRPSTVSDQAAAPNATPDPGSLLNASA